MFVVLMVKNKWTELNLIELKLHIYSTANYVWRYCTYRFFVAKPAKQFC